MKEKKPRKRKQADRATPVEIEQRVNAILEIRLDGSTAFEVRLYVAEKEAAAEAPWRLGEDGKGLSERQIRSYIAAADKLICANARQLGQNALRKHLTQRNRLYARAVNSGDLNTALAILRDLAQLQDLYPAKKVEAKHSGSIHATYEDLTDEELAAEVKRLEGLHTSAGSAASPPSA